MNKMLTKILVAGVFFILAAGNIGGCGGNRCDFVFNQFRNGGSAETQDSEWDCKRGGQFQFTIAFFVDGNGFRSDFGDMTWEQTRCRAVDIDTDSGTAELDNIDGSIATNAGVTLGNLTLDQMSEDLGDITVICEYVQFD